jgi:hypothetical protein
MGTDNLFHKRKARQAADLRRRKARREPYAKVLIVCEGETPVIHSITSIAYSIRIPMTAMTKQFRTLRTQHPKMCSGPSHQYPALSTGFFSISSIQPGLTTHCLKTVLAIRHCMTLGATCHITRKGGKTRSPNSRGNSRLRKTTPGGR